MSADKDTSRDTWSKLEALAKAVAALSAVVGSILIPYVIHTNAEKNRTEQARLAEENRMSQVYMQIMTEREKADTGIREQMFQHLLTNYLGQFQADPQNVREFKRRITFLDVLTLNFQEFLNAKPLFEDLHDRIADTQSRIGTEKAEELTNQLQSVARRVASRQSTMLAEFGHSVDFSVQTGKSTCVRLYKHVGLNDGDGTPLENPREDWDCNMDVALPIPASEEMSADVREEYAITVSLIEVKKSGAEVRIAPYLHRFHNKKLSSIKPNGTPLVFEVSYYDLPYMDNTKIFGGTRFSLLLKTVEGKSAFLAAVNFKEEFVSLRDRPFFEEMLEKLRGSGDTKGSGGMSFGQKIKSR